MHTNILPRTFSVGAPHDVVSFGQRPANGAHRIERGPSRHT
jgi:hypothetical protein